MEIVLNEISFTALLGSVILFTLTCANLVKSRGGQQQQQDVDAVASTEDKAEVKEDENKVSKSGLKYRRASSAPTQRKVRIMEDGKKGRKVKVRRKR